MKMGLGIVAIIMGLGAVFSPSVSPHEHINPKRGLLLNQVITGRTIAPVMNKMDEFLASESKEDVYIILDSPGGSVTAGMMFISRMQRLKDRGIRIHCFVDNLAASMAFQILTQCTTRQANTTSFLLWHGVRVQTDKPITKEVAKLLQEDLERFDSLGLYQLNSSIGSGENAVSQKFIRKHFLEETLWAGFSLHAAAPSFLTIKDSQDYVLKLAPQFTAMQEMDLLQLLLGGIVSIHDEGIKVFTESRGVKKK